MQKMLLQVFAQAGGQVEFESIPPPIFLALLPFGNSCFQLPGRDLCFGKPAPGLLFERNDFVGDMSNPDRPLV